LSLKLGNTIPGRLFTFGCSLTKYHYPTWADILGEQWEYSENWGKPGGGNTYIFNSIIECLHRNTFDQNDTVMILWSGIGRVDYYQLGHWYSKINAFSKDKEIPINCPDGHELTNFSLIYSIHELFKAKKIKFRSMTWVPYNLTSSNISELYKDTINEMEEFKFIPNKKFIPSYVSFNNFVSSFQTLYDTFKGVDWPTLESILNDSWQSDNLSQTVHDEILEFKNMMYKENKEFVIVNSELDRHPLPMEHLRVAQLMRPDITIKQSTVDFVKEVDQKLLENQPIKYLSRMPAVRIQV